MTKKIQTRQNPLKTALQPNTLEKHLSKPVGNQPTRMTFADKANNQSFYRSTVYKDANTSGDLDRSTGLYNLNPKVDVEGGIWYIDHKNSDIPNVDRGAELNASQAIQFDKSYNQFSNTYSAYAIQIGESKYDESYELLHTFFKKQSRFYLAISSDEFTKCTGAAILCPISSNYTFRKQDHINAIRDPKPHSVLNTTFDADVQTKKNFDSSFHAETDFNFFIETLVRGIAIDVSGSDADYNAKMKRYIAMKDAFSKQLYDPIPPMKDKKKYDLAQKAQDLAQEDFISMLGRPSWKTADMHANLSGLPSLKINCYIDIRYHSSTNRRNSIYSAISAQQLSKQARPIEYLIAHVFTLEAELNRNLPQDIQYTIDQHNLIPQKFQITLRDDEYDEILDYQGQPMIINLDFNFVNTNADIVLDEINTVPVPIRITRLEWSDPTNPTRKFASQPFDSTLIVSPANPRTYTYSPSIYAPKSVESEARYGGTHAGLISSRYTPSEKKNSRAKPEIRTSYITTEIFSLPTHYFFAMNDSVHSRKISDFQSKPLAHWQQFIIESLLPQNVNSKQNRYKGQLDSLKMHPNQLSATFPKNVGSVNKSAKYTNNIAFDIRKVQELVYSILANEITDIFKAWLGLGKDSNFNLSSLIDLLEGDAKSGNRAKSNLTESRNLDQWNTQNFIQITQNNRFTIQISTFPDVKIDNSNNNSIGCFFYSCKIFDDTALIYELDALSMYVLGLYIQANPPQNPPFFQTNPIDQSYSSFTAFESELNDLFNNKIQPNNLSLADFRKQILVPKFSRMCMELLVQYFMQELRVKNNGMTSLVNQYFNSQVNTFLSNSQNLTKLNLYFWENSLALFIDAYLDRTRYDKQLKSYLLKTPISPPSGMNPNLFDYKCAYRYQEIKTFFLFSYASLSSRTHVDIANYDDAIVYMHHATVSSPTTKMWQDSEKILNNTLDFDVLNQELQNAVRINPLKKGETEDDIKIMKASWQKLTSDVPITDLECWGVYSFFGTGKFVVPDLTTDTTPLGFRKSNNYRVELPNVPKSVISAIATATNSSLKVVQENVIIGRRLYVFIGDPEYAKITNQYYFAPLVTEAELSLDLTQQEPPQTSSQTPTINGRNYQYAIKVYQSGSNSQAINSNNFKDNQFEPHLKEVLTLGENLYIDFSRMFTTIGEPSIDVDSDRHSTILASTMYNGTIQSVDLNSPIGNKTTYLHKDQITQLNSDRFQVLGKSIIKQIFRPSYYACDNTKPIRDVSVNLVELLCQIYETPISIAVDLGFLVDRFAANLITRFKDVLSLDLLLISLSKKPSNRNQDHFVSKNLCSNAVFAFCDFLIALTSLSKQLQLDLFSKKNIGNQDLWFDEEILGGISTILSDLDRSLDDLRSKKMDDLPKVEVSIGEISSRFESLVEFLSTFDECQDILKRLVLGMHSIVPNQMQNTTLQMDSQFELIDASQWLFLASGVDNVDALEDVAMFAGGNLVNEVAHHSKNSKDYTASTKVKPPKLQPIGTKAPNVFGLHDMSGNAKELVKVIEKGQTYLGTFGGSYLEEPDDLRLLNLKIGNTESWFAKDSQSNKILLSNASLSENYKEKDVGFRFYIKCTHKNSTKRLVNSQNSSHSN